MRIRNARSSGRHHQLGRNHRSSQPPTRIPIKASSLGSFPRAHGAVRLSRLTRNVMELFDPERG